MKILLISTCKNKLSEYEFIRPFLKYKPRIENYKEIKSLRWADKIIITGTAIGDNEYLNKLEFFDWINKIKKPIVGICSGAQIIGLINGGKIIKNKEIGMVKTDGKIFGKKLTEVYSIHQNGIRNIKDFDIIVKSEKSDQIIKHKEKEIYGIYFHPEVRNMWIIDKFIEA